MTEVYSFYNYSSVNTFLDKLSSSHFKWGSVVTTDRENYKCNTFCEKSIPELIKNTPAILSDSISFSKNPDDFNDLINCLLKEMDWYAANDITMHFSFSTDSSVRFLVNETKLYKEIKDNIVINLGFYYNKELLTLDSIVNTNLSVSIFKKKLELKRTFVIRKKNLKKSDSIPIFKKMHLSYQASGILVHEVFGHLFEEDNYLEISKDISINIPPFISVIDSPRIKLCGFCLFDEEGNWSLPIVVIKDGKLQNLLKSNYSCYRQSYVHNSRSRLGFKGKELLPRMTNTILLTSYSEYVENQKDVLLIDSINFSKLHGSQLIFHIDSAEMELNGEVYRFSDLIASISVKEFIENIIAVYGKNKSFATASNCIKKGQGYVGVGFSVPQIIVSIEKCKSFVLSKQNK